MHIEHHEQTFTKQSEGNVSGLHVYTTGGNVELRLIPNKGDEARAVFSVQQTLALCCGLLDALHDCGVSIAERDRIADKLKLPGHYAA